MSVNALNVFTPAAEVTDPARFAGRSGELQALARALVSDGVQIVIHGNRGVGKSSLAHQLELLALGHEQVAQRLHDRPDTPLDYLTVYFRCDDSIASVPRLLLRLLSDDEALAAWVPYRVVAKEGSREVEGKLDVKVLSLRGSQGDSLTEKLQELESDIVSVFHNAVTQIIDAEVARDGVLIVIDEFDRIRDRTGLASLLKVMAPRRVKFALVGVATTVQELILEHESIARQLADGTVLVPPMSDKEMDEIFDRAEGLLEGRYHFDQASRSWIISVARGHPFYVHLLGKHALFRTVDSGATEVTAAAAKEAMTDIALKGSAAIQETLYKTAIGHSYVREAVLKEFASSSDEEIHTTEPYARLAKTLNVDPGAISVYIGHLASPRYGAVMEKSRERYYRFTDSLFKAYAAARPFQLKPGDREEG